VARRRTPRDLEVNERIAEAIAADRLLQDVTERGKADGQPQLNLGKRALKPRQMALQIDEPAMAPGDHLINGIGELKAAILNADPGVGQRHIAAIDVSNTGHV